MLSKAKPLLYLLIFALFIFNSCSDELITIVDEYNPPYEVKVIPGNNSISINFWSGILADDFVGFNLYIRGETEASFSNAVYGSDGGFPTYRVDTHTRSNFTLPFPASANIQNNQLYYVAVTAYGTNSLAEGEKIETKVNAIPVVTRTENPNIGDFSVTGGMVSLTSGGQIRAYGYQTNFNAITVFTNNNTSTSAPQVPGGLYIGLNGGTLSKLRINPDGTTYTSANHSRANDCNTI